MPEAPEMDLDTLEVGTTVSCAWVVTEAQVDAFAQLSEDVNPLHMQTSVAREYGFPRRVAHGLLALGAISRLIGTRLPGPGALWLAQDVQFVAPVLVGDRLEARVTVQQVSTGAQIITLRTEVTNTTTGAPVLVGSAKVKRLQRRRQEETGTVTDRVALVTGSSRGLGQAIALKLAEMGIAVVVHYHQRHDEAAAVVEEIRAGGGRAVAVQADLAQEEAIDALFQSASAAFGKIDIIVNNASPPILRQAYLEWRWADFHSYLETYVHAAFRLTQLAVPGMQARRFGRIVNILSSSALGVPPPRLAAYVTAKSALAGLSRAMAVELGPLGITVNMIAPSLLITDQTVALGDRARQLAASQAPLRRLAALDDVANTVAFLTSDAAAFITGVVIPVAGGEVMPT